MLALPHQHRTVAKDDLKMTLGIVEMTKPESLHESTSFGCGQRFESGFDSKSLSLGVWLFHVKLVTVHVILLFGLGTYGKYILK